MKKASTVRSAIVCVALILFACGRQAPPSTETRKSDVEALGPPYALAGAKYYDANANGARDADEVGIAGWKVTLTSSADTRSAWTDEGGAFSFGDVPEGDYTICEAMPDDANWIQTGPETVCYSVHVPSSEGAAASLAFGNLCLGPGGGQRAAFWTSKNGEKLFLDADAGASALALMRSLHLVDAKGNSFEPTSYAQAKKWFSAAAVKNMAYELSAQLAALELSVLRGLVAPDALLFAPEVPVADATGFVAVQTLVNAADAELALHASTPAGSAYRAYQAALSEALEAANKDRSFVQDEACPFTLPLEVAISAQAGCSAGPSGSATAVAHGGTAPYTYSWSTGSTSQIIDQLGAGSYTVAVTDAEGQTVSASAAIGESTPLAVRLETTTHGCAGSASGSVTAYPSGGSGSYTYVWSTGSTSQTVEELAPGAYSVTVEDSNHCSGTANVTFDEPEALVAGIEATPTCGGLHHEAFMSGGTGTLTPIITITGPGGFETVSLDLVADVSSNVAGSYTATIDLTDANGCRASASDTVDVYEVVQVVVEATDSCPADGDLYYDFEATVVGGSAPEALEYDWVLYGDGTVVGTEPARESITTAGRAMVSGPGTYQAELTVSDPTTGCVATHSASAEVWEPLQVALSATATSLTCPMESDAITFTGEVTGGSGAYAVVWDGEQAGDTCVDDTMACTIDPGGFCETRSITLTAKDVVATKCALATSAPATYDKTTTVTATEFSPPPAPVSAIAQLAMFAPSRFVPPDGWMDANVGFGGFAAQAISDGEATSGAAIVDCRPDPALEVSINAMPTCGGLRYEASASGGSGSFVSALVRVTGPGGFEWVSGELAGDVEAAVEGTYTATVEVIDANCSASTSDTVDVYAALQAFVETKGSCPADSSLYFDFGATVVGGSEDLVYEWTLYGDGAVVATIPELGPNTVGGQAMVELPGEYYAELTVTDTLTGCTSTDSASTKTWAPLQVTLSATATSLTCPMSSDAITATATVTGGSGSYAVTWDGDTTGDTCVDGTLTCTIDGGELCDSRTFTLTATDVVAPECAAVTSAPATYDKTTNVTAATY